MSYPELDARSAHAMLDRYRVIDVREPQEFLGPLGHIEGAELAPLATVAEHADVWKGDRPLLLVCRSGRRSGVACERLAERGCEDVTNLSGGMIAWNEAALPVARIEPESLAALAEQVLAWATQVGSSTREALLDGARRRCDATIDFAGSPSREAVAALLDHVAASFSARPPADLALCLDAFRRSLDRL